MNTREQYQAACRNYRMARMNRAHLISDRFDISYYKKSAFASVSPEMRELGEKSVIAGSVYDDDKFYQGGVYNNHLHWRLKKARKS